MNILFYGGYTTTLPMWWSDGYYAVFNNSGQIINTPRHLDRCRKAKVLNIENSSYLLTIGWRYFLPRYENDNASNAVYAFNNILNPFDSLISLSYYSSNFKIMPILENQNDAFIITNNNNISFYNNPGFENGRSVQPPCNVLTSPYKFNGSQNLLAGCTNSYFELRDTLLNLQAFIWGPNITISDADAVDINRDGTDELLCRTATGFVLYRLDTTSTAINEEISQLPGKLSILAYPNPFNSEVRLSLAGAENVPISIGIYDITGRLVRSLLAINGEALWDGTSDQGGEVSSGVYLIRAAAGSKSAVEKMILLR
jgi:hypothetical protein